MKLDKKGYDLIAKEEGIVLHPYLDSVKIPTIGVGNTFYPNGQKVTMKDYPITKEYAMEMFTIVADDFALKIDRLLKKSINQNQFNSLVSLAYNIGVSAFSKSTVLRLVNTNPCDGNIAKAFLMWRNAGGKPILLNRRIRESANYFQTK